MPTEQAVIGPLLKKPEALTIYTESLEILVGK